jgi:hypothetical protein
LSQIDFPQAKKNNLYTAQRVQLIQIPEIELHEGFNRMQSVEAAHRSVEGAADFGDLAHADRGTAD